MNDVPFAQDSLAGGFLAGGGALGAMMRERDWSRSPLGAPAHWPLPLKTLVALMLASGQPMFTAWGRERTLLYNDAYVPILGRKHPAALGGRFLDVWSEARADLEPMDARVFAGEAVHGDDIELMLDREGVLEEAHFAFSYTPVRDEAGLVAGLFCACTETTGAVLARQRELLERRRLADMFEQAPSFIALLEGPEHRGLLANAAYKRLVGGRDMVGRTVAEALPDAVEQGYLALLDRVFATGTAFSSTGSEFMVQATPGGEVTQHFVDFIFQPVFDATGRVTGIFVEGADVTERTRAEAALRESEAQLRHINATLEQRVAERTAQLQANQARLRTIFETSYQLQGLLARDGTLLDANATSLAAIGKRLEDVVGQKFWMTPWFARTPGMSHLVREAVERVGLGEAFRQEVVVELPAGRRAFDLSLRPIRDASGAVVAIVPEAIELTERRAAEEQLRQAQKMEAVGQLTGGLAHDFNNLLTGIAGSLELLQVRIAQGRLANVDRYITAAQGAAKRAAALTHRLLAFSRQQTLDPRPVRANVLIADMEDLIRRTVGPQIKVETVLAIGLWPTLCDPNQLESALLNLCINARDAMPDGGRLTIETANSWLDERGARERDMAPGQYVALCVSDTGTGMTRDVAARAFDPFFTTKPIGQGTGLGLSMIYGFARQSNGQVRIYSELGEGTTMRLYLPRHWGEVEEEDVASHPGEPPRAEAGETVLIVDDEPTVRMLIADVLEDLGYTAIEAADAPSGLKVLQSNIRIDLLITDVGLPGGINGRQLADTARTTRPELKVLFITGYAENALLGQGQLAAGMQVVTKPFSMDLLAARIKTLVTAG